MKIKNLYIKNVKFQKNEIVFNDKLKTIGFISCEFPGEFDLIELFHEKAKEKIEALSFLISELPNLKKEN